MDAPRGLSRKRAREHGATFARARRDALAVAVLFGGVVLWAFLLLRTEAPAPGVAVLLLLAPLLVGAAAAALLGPGAFATTLAARPSARAIGLALPAAALMLGVGIALACLLSLALGETPDLSFGMPGFRLLLELAVLPALVEEWLCRGVLWTACARLTTRGGTIAATALLFALMHVPAWGPLHVPDALFAGVVLGVLRDRTGSLAPGVLAHFLNNAVAAALLVG